MDLSEKESRVQTQPSFLSISLGFGTILFVFGGISAFPTIQNDMKEQHKFPQSVFLAYFGKLYTLVPILQLISQLFCKCLG